MTSKLKLRAKSRLLPTTLQIPRTTSVPTPSIKLIYVTLPVPHGTLYASWQIRPCMPAGWKTDREREMPRRAGIVVKWVYGNRFVRTRTSLVFRWDSGDWPNRVAGLETTLPRKARGLNICPHLGSLFHQRGRRNELHDVRRSVKLNRSWEFVASFVRDSCCSFSIFLNWQVVEWVFLCLHLKATSSPFYRWNQAV